MNTSDKRLELDLGKLLQLLWKRAWILLLGTLLGAVLTVLLTWVLVTPQYRSSVMLYVQQTQSAKDLADSFEVIVKMRESLMDVIQYTGMNYSHIQLQDQIAVSSVNDTDFFQVTVSSPSASEAAMIANSIGQILPRQISEIMEGTTVKVVGEAIPAREPSTPNYPNSALLGAAAGLLTALAGVLAWDWLGLGDRVLSKRRKKV